MNLNKNGNALLEGKVSADLSAEAVRCWLEAALVLVRACSLAAPPISVDSRRSAAANKLPATNHKSDFHNAFFLLLRNVTASTQTTGKHAPFLAQFFCPLLGIFPPLLRRYRRHMAVISR